jgi:hypothetical protein
LASGLLQRCELQGGVLVVGRYAGVAVFHRSILNLIFDTRQPRCLRRSWRRVKTYPF